jgi:hypothetical protein
MKARRVALRIGALWCLLHAAATTGDTLHGTSNGAYWHHDSGFTFPQRIGAFVRIGVPQDVAGSSDVVVHYATDSGERISAIVDVYPSDTAMNDRTLEAARKSFERDSGSTYEAPSSGSFAVGEIKGTKLVYVPRSNTATVPRLLYFVELDHWRAKVQVTANTVRSDIVELGDAFVRDFPWSSYGGQAP